VRVIVGQAAGSGSDTAARLIGQFLSERLGQQFVIENRPGAGAAARACIGRIMRSNFDGLGVRFSASLAGTRGTARCRKLSPWARLASPRLAHLARSHQMAVPSDDSFGVKRGKISEPNFVCFLLTSTAATGMSALCPKTGFMHRFAASA